MQFCHTQLSQCLILPLLYPTVLIKPYSFFVSNLAEIKNPLIIRLLFLFANLVHEYSGTYLLLLVYFLFTNTGCVQATEPSEHSTRALTYSSLPLN